MAVNENKNGNPVPLSVKMYLLLGFLLLTCIQKSVSCMVGFYMRGNIKNIL